MPIVHVVFVGMALTWMPAHGEQNNYDDMTHAQIKAVQMTASRGLLVLEAPARVFT
jgi:hypothetical protein